MKENIDETHLITKKWKDFPCSWIERINIAKNVRTMQKFMYSTEFLSKYQQHASSTETEKPNQIHMGACKIPKKSNNFE